jgi:hypothetical protein
MSSAWVTPVVHRNQDLEDLIPLNFSISPFLFYLKL